MIYHVRLVRGDMFSTDVSDDVASNKRENAAMRQVIKKHPEVASADVLDVYPEGEESWVDT